MIVARVAVSMVIMVVVVVAVMIVAIVGVMVVVIMGVMVVVIMGVMVVVIMSVMIMICVSMVFLVTASHGASVPSHRTSRPHYRINYVFRSLCLAVRQPLNRIENSVALCWRDWSG